MDVPDQKQKPLGIKLQQTVNQSLTEAKVKYTLTPLGCPWKGTAERNSTQREKKYVIFTCKNHINHHHCPHDRFGYIFFCSLSLCGLLAAELPLFCVLSLLCFAVPATCITLTDCDVHNAAKGQSRQKVDKHIMAVCLCAPAPSVILVGFFFTSFKWVATDNGALSLHFAPPWPTTTMPLPTRPVKRHHGNMFYSPRFQLIAYVRLRMLWIKCCT